MANKRVFFDNIDAELLEEQRLLLATINGIGVLTPDQMEALNGIQNMLDAWADERDGIK